MFSNNNSELQIVIRARDEASKAIERVQGRVSNLNTMMQRSAAASRTFALGLAGAATAVGGLGFVALKAAADMEQTQIAFTTMLGSGEKADKFIRELVQFAKTTPFELRGLENASKQLLAYGFTQDEVLPNLRALGDIASGVGMDKLPNLILAFGQVRAATRLTGMELRQFTEAGVPLLEELSVVMGKPVSEIQALVSEGKVGFPLVQQALQNLTAEGGRFNNLMDKQAQSLGGMISNLKDSWDIFLRGEGQKLIEWAKRFVQIIIHIVENVLPVFIQKIETIIKFFVEHKAAAMALAGFLAGGLVAAIYAVIAAFVAMVPLLAPFMIGGAIVGGLSPVSYTSSRTGNRSKRPPLRFGMELKNG